MENIICIELTKYNNEKLLEVSNILNINYDDLVKYKQIGNERVWISSDNNLIAYTTKRDKSTIIFTEDHKKMFLEIKAVENKIKSEKLNLSIDDILEKITKCGLNSLTRDEKNFLDEESKK